MLGVLLASILLQGTAAAAVGKPTVKIVMELPGMR